MIVAVLTCAAIVMIGGGLGAIAIGGTLAIVSLVERAIGGRNVG